MKACASEVDELAEYLGTRPPHPVTNGQQIYSAVYVGDGCALAEDDFAFVARQDLVKQ